MVFREGDVAGAMYIVIRGMCAMQGRVITGGKFFGEDMIMGGRRLADCRALTFLDVYELEKDSLDSILEDGKYSKRKRACIAYMESTVVNISIPPPSFKPVALFLSRSPLF